MATAHQRRKGRRGSPPKFDPAIDAMNLAEKASSITPAKAVFRSVSSLLTALRDSVANGPDYVELSLSCADVCHVLNRGLSGRRSDELGRSVLEAIELLTTTVAAIQRRINKKGKRNAASRLLWAKNDRSAIAAWKQDLVRILHVFNTELAINTHLMVADIRRNALAGQQDACGEHHPTQASTPPGEVPPPPPRACFGRDELVEEILSSAENLKPIALIGTGGIGKTAIALTVLHHDRIRERFGDNRRFIRCDQFSATPTDFLRRLSIVIGAGVEDPRDLTPLRHFLSSKELFVVLDNAESILDPQGTNSHEIYALLDELCRFETVCLCITSRITMVPRHCKRPAIPALSMEAACEIFYGIYDGQERSGIIDDLLQRLDFHALSITLLATAAAHNMWDSIRLAKEWDSQRAELLRTDYNESLAATLELSLASPTFRKLGPGARDLLGVVAFFPQGIDENNLDWLFPNISGRKNTFDKLCVLSLTYRNNGFITMLSPIRDYFRPRDPGSSPLLCATKDLYFSRLSVDINPHMPGFVEARWITSEDVNVEHLLDIFTSINTNSDDAWHACLHFMRHLFWHKRRHTMLIQKIKLLPPNHPFKIECSYELSRLCYSVGDHVEQKRLLTHTLSLLEVQGDDRLIARTLQSLSGANLHLDLNNEGILQAKKALEIFEQLGDAEGRAWCLNVLARLLHNEKQLDAAEEIATRATNQKSGEYLACQAHRILGDICHSNGKREKAIKHFETALRAASAFNWHNELLWTRYSLALLFSGEGRFDDAQDHIEGAKPHAADNAYDMGHVVLLQARIWYRQRRLEEAASEALRALEIFEKVGAAKELGRCEALIRIIERAMGRRATVDNDSNPSQRMPLQGTD